MTTLAMFLIALVPQDDQPLPKIAELASISGDVQIVSVKGAVRKPAKFGTRLKNAEIRDEDHVKTGAGAQAVIRFPDDSKFTLKENGELQVLQKDLPKATPEGNTVGRRLRLLVGDLVSEVLPNKDVRTEFESPAGSAAVRGTIVRLVYDAGKQSLRATIDEGLLRYFNTDFATVLDLPRGTRVVFTKGSLDILIEAGDGIEGSIGDQGVRLNAGDRLLVDTQAGGFSCDIRDGIIDVKDSAGAFQPVQQDFQAAPDPAASHEGAFFNPMAPTGAVWDGAGHPPPPPGEFLGERMGPPPPPGSLPPPGTFPPPGTLPLGGEYLPPPDMLNFVSTSYGGTSGWSVTYPLVIDAFERPDGTFIGNGWFQNGMWDISTNMALATMPPGGGVAIERNIGHFSTCDFSATFRYSDSSVYPFIEVNALPQINTGMRLIYEAAPGNLKIFAGNNLLGTLGGVGTASPGSDFTLTLGCDGTMAHGALGGQSGIGGSFGVPAFGCGPGSILRVGGVNTGAAAQTLRIDSIMQHAGTP